MANRAPGASPYPSELMPRTDPTAVADDPNLHASLAGLARLSAGPDEAGFQDMLRQVADFAAHAITGADGAGLTVLERDRPDTTVASAEFVREVDAIQYGLGEGPCITATSQARTVRTGSVSRERSWPRFGSRAGRLGVHSVLSLPLLVPAGAVVGSLNVYGHAQDAFDERAVEIGQLFAAPAAVSVLNAQALAQAHRLVGQLRAALTSRAVIDQALGIVMSRSGCTPEEAFDKLRAVSQAENRKSSAIAHTIVDQAVRRARARNAGG